MKENITDHGCLFIITGNKAIFFYSWQNQTWLNMILRGPLCDKYKKTVRDRHLNDHITVKRGLICEHMLAIS